MKLVNIVEVRPIGPVVHPTPEERVENVVSLLDSARDSYQTMVGLSMREHASRKGVKASKKVCQKYGERLEELAKEEFSGYTVEELHELTAEISDIITAIREARDQLQSP